MSSLEQSSNSVASAKSRAPRSQMAMSGQKLLSSPSAKFPALRKCHHLNSPQGSGERRMGAAAVLLEGASVVREGSRDVSNVTGWAELRAATLQQGDRTSARHQGLHDQTCPG